MPQVARSWCHRHVAAYLAPAPKLGPVAARRVLEPLINLARLQVRAGEGERAAALVRDLYTAVDSRTDTVIDGIELPSATMTGDAESHREIRRWLWAVMLATTARALAATGHWSEARAALSQAKGIGNKMLDGRQIAVLERVERGDPDGALELVRATEPGEPSEHTVALCLAALSSRSAGGRQAPDELLASYFGLPTRAGFTVFHTRLGLAVIDTLGGPETPACRDTALTLIANVIHGGDGYAARDLLTHAGYSHLMSAPEAQHLTHQMHACALGHGSLPAPLHADLAAALDTSEKVIIQTREPLN
jgi:hypothetical protein